MPLPNSFKYGRAQGGISNIELEKLGIGTRRPNKVFQPKRILPKNFRDDPFADPPPITETDIKDGMYSLLNRGIIPRDVDLSPAFERGKAPFTHQQSQIELKGADRPPQWKHQIVPGPANFISRYPRKRPLLQGAALPDPEVIPEVDLHRGRTFLTAMNVEDHEALRTTAQREMMKRTSGDSNDLEATSVMKGFGESRVSQASRSGGAQGTRFDAQPGSPSQSGHQPAAQPEPGSQGRDEYQVMVYDENPQQSLMDHAATASIQDGRDPAATPTDSDGPQAAAKAYASGEVRFLIDKGVLKQDNAEF